MFGGIVSEKERGMKIGRLIGSVAALAAVPILAIGAYYHSRRATISTLKKITSFDSPYNLYSMEVKYDYDLDRIIERTLPDDASCFDAMLKEAIPFIPVHVKAPMFGCSAFTLSGKERGVLMGRNYDFKNNTSALLVRTNPKSGYRSIAFAALDNLSANVPENDLKFMFSGLVAPFVCLDGLNEKGVSIAVLTLDSTPTRQFEPKKTLFTTMAIRLVLDRASSTQEAVDLLSRYNMFATSGRDYHFYITDAAGDGRVVEFDCDKDWRPMVVTPTRSVTNFFVMYKDKVLPFQRNGEYGHGRERYDAIEDILSAHENEALSNKQVAWEALRASSQEPKEGDVTSNTQWSIVYDNQNFSGEVSIRRNWDVVYRF